MTELAHHAEWVIYMCSYVLYVVGAIALFHVVRKL